MISVVVPAYNNEATIARTVDSIFQQTFRDIEVVIINDGSADRTQDQIDLLMKRYPGRIQSETTENRGVTAARLNGVRKASGEWIGFVDADDVIEPDMYETLIGLAEKHQADIAHCGFQMISSNGKTRFFYNTGRLEILSREEGLKALLEGDYIEPSLCNKLFRKNLFTDLLNGIQDSTIRYNEDLLMNYYLFSGASVSAYLDTCKYHYLVNAASATHRTYSRQRIYDPIRVKEIIMTDADEKVKTTAQKVYLRTCINIYNGLMKRKDRSYGEDEKAVRKRIVSGRKYIPLLSKKQRLLADLILILPHGYRYIYRFYSKHFLKSRYL